MGLGLVFSVGYNTKMALVKKNLFAIFLTALVIALPTVSFAQNVVDEDIINSVSRCPAGRICNPIAPIDSINGLIKVILEGALKIGIPLIALAVIYCGFLFVYAQGKPDEIKKAKDALLYTLIGAAILLGSWAIAQLISETVLAL